VNQERPAVKVQLEADSLAQVKTFLDLRGVDIILLDNMSPALLREAVRLNAGRLFLEASGGITLSTIQDVAATGVDAISVGAIYSFGTRSRSGARFRLTDQGGGFPKRISPFALRGHP
jgi:nicotinate-nucleotide pyrophosphorylase (carboxylating)